MGRSGYATDRKSRGTLGHAGDTIYNLLIAGAQRTGINGIIYFNRVINTVSMLIRIIGCLRNVEMSNWTY